MISDEILDDDRVRPKSMDDCVMFENPLIFFSGHNDRCLDMCTSVIEARKQACELGRESLLKVMGFTVGWDCQRSGFLFLTVVVSDELQEICKHACTMLGLIADEIVS